MTNRSQPSISPGKRPRGAICAYRRCSQGFQGFELPQDWRSIVMAPGSLLNKRTLLNADRDGLLCPTHVSEILRYLRPGDGTCSWRECLIQGVDIRDAFNRGWRHLVVCRELLWEASSFLSADHDGVLCYRHYREINDLLKPLPK